MWFFRGLRASAIAIALVLVPATAQAETLRQALESAYVNNPDLMSALLSVKSAAEDIALRKAGYDARYMAGGGHFAWKAVGGKVRRLEE